MKKGTITPRKITRYVVDIKCPCGRKETYYSYETNKRRAIQHLPILWNGWRLSPTIRCFRCYEESKKQKPEIGVELKYKAMQLDPLCGR